MSASSAIASVVYNLLQKPHCCCVCLLLSALTAVVGKQVLVAWMRHRELLSWELPSLKNVSFKYAGMLCSYCNFHVISGVPIPASYVKAFESYCLTDRQTEIINHTASWVIQKTSWQLTNLLAKLPKCWLVITASAACFRLVNSVSNAGARFSKNLRTNLGKT